MGKSREAVKQLLSLLFGIVRKLPIVSGLPDIEKENFFDSVKETIVTVLISTMPIWLGAFVIAALKGQISFDLYSHGLMELTKKGELILYSSSLLAPVYFILFSDKPNSKRFPSKTSHLVVVTIILMIAAVFYALSLSSVDDISNTRNFSLIVFGISIFLLIVSQAYRNNIVDPAGTFKRNEKDFADGYDRHRRAS